ncbi:uncharacterized protein LOC144104164 isoform X2 [Amblyomma americanum]
MSASTARVAQMRKSTETAKAISPSMCRTLHRLAPARQQRGGQSTCHLLMLSATACRECRHDGCSSRRASHRN